MSTPEPTSTEGLTVRIEHVSAELRELEDAIKAGDIDSRVFAEFRRAVDDVRRTAWTVQEWIHLQAKHRDAYTVLPSLTAERIRRTAQLSQDLSMDLDTAEVTIETEGLRGLFHALEGLHSRLAPFFRKS